MEIDAYLYDYNGCHIFYFENTTPLTLLNKLYLKEINISNNLFLEISEGERYRWFDKEDINVNNYKDLLTILNTINNLFISKLELKSDNFSLKVHDHRDITIEVVDINLIVPIFISVDLFEILSKNKGKYVVYSSDCETKVNDSFDDYITKIKHE